MNCGNIIFWVASLLTTDIGSAQILSVSKDWAKNVSKNPINSFQICINQESSESYQKYEDMDGRYKNTDEYLTQRGNETENSSRKILCGGAQGSVAFLGIIGNIISIVIFSRPKMNSSSDKILLGKDLSFWLNTS